MGINKSKRREIFIAFLGSGAVLAILTGFGIIFFFFSSIKNIDMATAEGIQSLSTLGEFFGGTVGTIWALAGVILFYLALIYQRRELELQRDELLETRAILNHQSMTIEIQQFENTFFQLLDFHIQASKRIESQSDGNGFENMFEELKKAIAAMKRKRKKDGGSQNLDEHAFETSFRNVYDGYRNTLSHYIESFKALIFFIEGKSRDPVFYINILKPHLSEQEVLIQFYYLVLYSKDEKFRKAVERYGLFEKLNTRAVQTVDKLHLDMLSESAYKETIQAQKEENGKEAEQEEKETE
jgi:hypothetical protein